MERQEFFAKALKAARDADHIWPEFAACEAALESAWGESKLARLHNNLFGQKKGFSTEGCEVVPMLTHEVLTPEQVLRVKHWPSGTPERRADGNFDCTVEAMWPKFADWTQSFKARMSLLERSSIYKDALKAQTGEEFVEEVSRHWATDPQRGHKVMATYHANEELIMKLQGIGL